MKKILGYADCWSLTPGATVRFKVSTYGPSRYRADLVRVICGDNEPEHGVFHEEEMDAPFNGDYDGRFQPIDAGSYAVVEGSTALQALESFTLQAWILPTTPNKGEQGLVTNWRDDPAAGFALVIDANGALAFRVADGNGATTDVATGKPLVERRWYLATGVYDAAAGEIRVSQVPSRATLENLRPASASKSSGEYESAGGPLLFAAFPDRLSNGKLGSRSHFNGKMDSPRILAEPLSAQDLDALAEDPATAAARTKPFAVWDFSRDIGTAVISDTGDKALHGHTVNVPSRGCKGFNWTGQEQNWQHAPQEYGAIHFHDDDLYDAAWETDFEYVIPDALRSGIYAARLRAEEDETYITFFVRPPKGKTTSKLAFLVSTATYMAYSNYQWLFHQHYAEVTESLWTTMEKTDVFLQEHNELGLSTYDNHSDGSGVRYASRLRPILNMAPKTPLWSFNPDTHITGWLEDQGYDYDVITDEDLHHEGAGLLEPYRVVLTGAHPEYYTTPMLEGLRDYIAGPGRLIYLGGNGFIWRCALSDKLPGILELRRAEDGIRYRDEEPGEYYLEFTGEYGGLWRRLGIPPQALVGVGTIAVGFDVSGYYKRKPASFDPRAQFIFEDIGDDEVIGDFGFLGGGASGSEIDYVDPMLGTPKHALVVASSEGHSANTLIVPDEIGFHHVAMDGTLNPNVRADMTFFETPGGGAVFSVGSIAWGASLPCNQYDNNVSRLTGNVLKRFLADEPFSAPE
jgi:N,N-dimethylformamidase